LAQWGWLRGLPGSFLSGSGRVRIRVGMGAGCRGRSRGGRRLCVDDHAGEVAHIWLSGLVPTLFQQAVVISGTSRLSSISGKRVSWWRFQASMLMPSRSKRRANPERICSSVSPENSRPAMSMWKPCSLSHCMPRWRDPRNVCPVPARGHPCCNGRWRYASSAGRRTGAAAPATLR